ncbi:MAG TPA: metallophosphoesterase, partial [Thermomicrobiales bacterium]|nr:metallophosphoesterase [Thermomicrobiales bacterium]
VNLMIELKANPALVGNHDLACIGGLSVDEFNDVAKRAARWTAGELGDEQRSYLRSLPSMTVRGEFTLAHASPREPIWEYVNSAQTATASFRYFESRGCLVGHTHRAIVATLVPGEGEARISLLRDGDVIRWGGARFLINPGSVGQPRDRDPRAAYGIVDTDERTFTEHRVAYDIEETQQQMAEAGLPSMLGTRLSLGI